MVVRSMEERYGEDHCDWFPHFIYGRTEYGGEMQQIILTPVEWNIMESLWEEAPKIGREIVRDVKESAGYSRSTTLTMLTRMTKKGYLECLEDEKGIKTYRPLIDRQRAMQQETDHFLNRVYHGSLYLLVSTFTEKQKLSREEIDSLYEILRKAEEEQHD